MQKELSEFSHPSGNHDIMFSEESAVKYGLLPTRWCRDLSCRENPSVPTIEELENNEKSDIGKPISASDDA